MKFLILALVLVAPLSALAHDNYSCIREEWSLLGSTAQVDGKCYLTQALEKREGEHSYPKMSHNPYLVKYWVGSYGLSFKVQNHYAREVYDVCRGRLLIRDDVFQDEISVQQYSVENPNLSDDISESFRTLAMTPEEAQAQMDLAKANCEKDSN